MAIVLFTPTFSQAEPGLSLNWQDSTASVIGMPAKAHATVGSGCAAATAYADYPAGIVASVARQYEGVKLFDKGLCYAVAGTGGVTAGSLVKVCTDGTGLINATQTAFPNSTVDYTWGRAETTAAVGTMFVLRIRFMPIMLASS